MVYGVIADVAKVALVGSPGGPKTLTSHDNDAEAKPLDLKAEPLFHIAVFHYVDLEGDVGIDQGLGKVWGLSGCKCIKIILKLLMLLLVSVFLDG